MSAVYNGHKASPRSPDTSGCHPGERLHYLPELLDIFGVEMAITVKENMEVTEVMEAFGKLARRDRTEMCLRSEGKVVDEYETLYCVSVLLDLGSD